MTLTRTALRLSDVTFLAPNVTTSPGSLLLSIIAGKRGRPIISGLRLELAAGEAAAVVGPNGSGKTTLCRLIAGELEPDSGRIELAGKDLTGRPWERSRLAFLISATPISSTLAWWRVEDVVLDAARVAGRAIEPEDVLERYGLLGLRESQIRWLSTGERRRLDMAVADARSPVVLLLDEARVSLDERGLSALETLISTVRRRGGAVVETSVDASLVPEDAAVYDLRDGRLTPLS